MQGQALDTTKLPREVKTSRSVVFQKRKYTTSYFRRTDAIIVLVENVEMGSKRNKDIYTRRGGRERVCKIMHTEYISQAIYNIVEFFTFYILLLSLRVSHETSSKYLQSNDIFISVNICTGALIITRGHCCIANGK